MNGVNPDYYRRREMECKDAIDAFTCDLPALEAWRMGNVLKYLWRYRGKGSPSVDLQKARTYLDDLIAVVEDASDTEGMPAVMAHGLTKN